MPEKHVTVPDCERKHRTTTWFLGTVVTVGLFICGFAWDAGSGAREAAGKATTAVDTVNAHLEHIRESQGRLEGELAEVRKTQMQMLRNGGD